MNAIRIPRASDDVPDPVDLCAHDPARGLTTDPGAADALLSSIVATPIDVPDDESAPAESSAPTPIERHPRRRRVWLAAAAAVAVLAGGAITQSATPAYAGWTAIPTAMAAPDVPDNVLEQCRRLFSPTPGAPLEGQMSQAQVDALRPVLAERRGPYMLTVLAHGSDVADCTVQYKRAWSRDFPFFRVSGGAYGGYNTDPSATAPLTPRQMRILSIGGGQVNDEDEMAQVTGLVGTEVRSVAVRRPGDTSVQATVVGRHFAAWWPGRPANLDEEMLEVTYTDGTTAVLEAKDLYPR